MPMMTNEKKEKKIRTSFQVRLMLLLLVDAKENVIKNLFMAANAIFLNPSFALYIIFFYIRFDERAQSAHSTALQIVQLPYWCAGCVIQ